MVPDVPVEPSDFQFVSIASLIFCYQRKGQHWSRPVSVQDEQFWDHSRRLNDAEMDLDDCQSLSPSTGNLASFDSLSKDYCKLVTSFELFPIWIWNYIRMILLTILRKLILN